MKKFRALCQYSWHLFALILSLFWTAKIAFSQDVTPNWVSVTHTPFIFVEPSGITNPVLTANNVTDVSASFVADPFLFYENAQWYMFFEVFNAGSNHGDIGLATSIDGLHWNYEQIVLSENWHLSYPLVFKNNGKYYLIPETYQRREVRVYQATTFPYAWSYVSTLVSGREFVDPTVFYYSDTWWMFVSDTSNSKLYLYFSDDLTTGWTEHPKSPVVNNDASKARPGGRSFVYDNDRIIRIAQKDNVLYGEQVRAFDVYTLTKTDYAEREVSQSPILKPSGIGWNKNGMHHFDPWWNANNWLCAVDGKNGSLWSIGLYIAAHTLSNQLVSNVIVSSGEAYQVMPYGLQLGSRPYLDRTFYFTGVPGYLAGETYIQTANDDKQSTGSDFLSFDVNQDVTVYVAYEAKIEPKPSWLLAFTDTGDRLVSTDKSLRIYASDFPAGKVTLGGNQGSRYNSMYVVIVLAKIPSQTAILDRIEIEGSLTVSENDTADYNCRAYYTDGTSLLVEPDTWDVDCAYANISSTGILTTYDVDGDEACQITAYYLEGNIAESDTFDTTITDSNGNQLVSNVIVSSGEAYQVMPYGLQLGSRPYLDRTFYFTGVPGYLAGETYIQTANDDKQSTGSDFLSFDVNQDVTVYVAYEAKIEPKPSWLLAFTDTGDRLVSTDKSLRIYARDFPAGKVTLGGNQGSRYNSMYVVIVSTYGQ